MVALKYFRIFARIKGTRIQIQVDKASETREQDFQPRQLTTSSPIKLKNLKTQTIFMKTKLLISILSVLCLSFLLSCNKNEEKTLPQRTVLIYMAGDNSLSSFVEYNMKMIEEGCKNADLENGNIIAYIDERGATPGLYQSRKDKNGIVSRNLIKEYEEENSASPENLRSVITTVKEQFPSESMGIVLWSHGTAWLPSNLDSYLRSFGQDGNNYMELDDLSYVLNDFHFDFILFDACYMASVEVVYALRNCTDYIIGSATEILADGFPYNEITPMLLNADVTGIADSFYNHYDQMSGVSRSASVSVVKTSELDNLADACRNILSRQTEESLYNIDLYQVQALEYLTWNNHKLYDMEDYLSQIASNEEYTNLKTAMDKAIIYKACTPENYFAQCGSIAIDKFSGLSIYAYQKNYPKLNDWYDQLEWATYVSK